MSIAFAGGVTKNEGKKNTQALGSFILISLLCDLGLLIMPKERNYQHPIDFCWRSSFSPKLYQDLDALAIM